MKDMHCPDKYKAMGSFWEYYSGHEKAPFLTIFISGNHEAVNSLRELPLGGWVAENIYYLGAAGLVILSKGCLKVRVSWLSGIYKHYDFKNILKREPYPLKEKEKISSYHQKQIDLYRLELFSRLLVLKAEKQK